MDWLKKVLEIKQKLSDNGHTYIVNKITDAQMVLGTPGEMYLEVMGVLLDVKKNGGKELKLIHHDIEELLNYGRSINYFIG